MREKKFLNRKHYIGKNKGLTNEQILRREIREYNKLMTQFKNDYVYKEDVNLPAKIKANEMVKNITNKEEFNTLIKYMKKAKNPINHRVIRQDNGLAYTRLTKIQLEDFNKLGNDWRKKVKEENENRQLTQHLEKTGFTVKEGRSQKKLNDHFYDEKNINLEKTRAGLEFNRLQENVFNRLFMSYYNKMDIQCKNNYLKSLNNLLGCGADEIVYKIIKAVENMSPDRVAQLVITEVDAEINENYYFSSYIRQLQKISRLFIQNKKEYDEIMEEISDLDIEDFSGRI